MTSGSGLQVKGALIRARLQFISDRFGSAAKRRAEMAIGERSDISHGILLASYWYPMAITYSLERTIESQLLDRGGFSWQEVGSYEARLLLKGSHAAMVKPTPEAMADRVPLIFSSLYQGFGVRTRLWRQLSSVRELRICQEKWGRRVCPICLHVRYCFRPGHGMGP